ncbi:MAG TPA: hypothetical protein VHT50_15620 [Mycobacterium sp.]|nr:hypothetical protein [Mycobacterium sp.]
MILCPRNAYEEHRSLVHGLAEEHFLLDREKENQVELEALAFVRGQDPNGGCISKPADRFDGSTPALDLLVEPLEC